MKENYDLIIIGAGPSGLTAALFALRYKLKVLVIGQELGGQLNYAHKIENYPGIHAINGQELKKIMKAQVENLGCKRIEQEVKGITKEKGMFKIITDSSSYHARAIILGLGTMRRKLNLPQEDKFIGKGVSHCVTCDAAMFKNKTVAIVGGSNAAVMDAMLLAKYVKKLYVIYRGSKLRAEPIRVEQIKKNKKIEIIYNSEVRDIHGKKFLESITLSNGKKLAVNGLFIEVGNVPHTFLTSRLGIKKDSQGYIIVNSDMETNVKGIYAAGDCISKKLRQLVNACGDGAIAAFSAYLYLQNKK
jgi:thioredoxin reductase (NADPH)